MTLDFKSSLAIEISKQLMHDERTQDSAIEVVDDGGVVTLIGTATSKEARNAAEEIARNQEGTTTVVSELKTKSKARRFWPLS